MVNVPGVNTRNCATLLHRGGDIAGRNGKLWNATVGVFWPSAVLLWLCAAGATVFDALYVFPYFKDD